MVLATTAANSLCFLSELFAGDIAIFGGRQRKGGPEAVIEVRVVAESATEGDVGDAGACEHGVGQHGMAPP